MCVCNQDFPGSKQRRTDSPIDPQTLHSPPSQQVPCPPIPNIQLLFFLCIFMPFFNFWVHLNKSFAHPRDPVLFVFLQYLHTSCVSQLRSLAHSIFPIFPPSLVFAGLFIVGLSLIWLLHWWFQLLCLPYSNPDTLYLLQAQKIITEKIQFFALLFIFLYFPIQSTYPIGNLR